MSGLIGCAPAAVIQWVVEGREIQIGDISFGKKISRGSKFQNIFVIPVLNMVWRIVAGTRYDYRDPRMTVMARKVVAISRSI